MLIRNSKLIAGLTNFSIRNNIIQHCNSKDPALGVHCFHKLVLGFWLGSNSTLQKMMLSEHYFWYKKYKNNIFVIYFCILILDKQISLLSHSSDAYQVLKTLRQDIFTFYNKHYEQLTDNIDTFFSKVKSIINDVDIIEVNNKKDKALILYAQKCCNDEIANLISYNKGYYSIQPTKHVFSVSNKIGLELNIVKKFHIFSHQILSANLKLHPFYVNSQNPSSDIINKILIQEKTNLSLRVFMQKSKKLILRHWYWL